MGELETAVMDILWDTGRPLAPAAVLTGRAYAYRELGTREQYVAARMGEVLLGVADRPRALGYFFRALDPSDHAQLEQLLGARKD